MRWNVYVQAVFSISPHIILIEDVSGIGEHVLLNMHIFLLRKPDCPVQESIREEDCFLVFVLSRGEGIDESREHDQLNLSPFMTFVTGMIILPGPSGKIGREFCCPINKERQVSFTS